MRRIRIDFRGFIFDEKLTFRIIPEMSVFTNLSIVRGISRQRFLENLPAIPGPSCLFRGVSSPWLSGSDRGYRGEVVRQNQ